MKKKNCNLIPFFAPLLFGHGEYNTPIVLSGNGALHVEKFSEA